MKHNPNTHLVRMALVLVAIIAALLIGKAIFTPDTFGEYGHYRAEAITDEAARDMVYGGNQSCVSCHEEVFDMKEHSEHQRLSCESCHSAVGDHVRDGEKYADMPYKQGVEVRELCMSCHDDSLVARPAQFPAIDLDVHPADQGVSPDRDCGQCHVVHAPLKTIKKARELIPYEDPKEER